VTDKRTVLSHGLWHLYDWGVDDFSADLPTGITVGIPLLWSINCNWSRPEVVDLLQSQTSYEETDTFCVDTCKGWRSWTWYAQSGLKKAFRDVIANQTGYKDVDIITSALALPELQCLGHGARD